ncbi:META domain-containing protein [Winogradskyella aquimaris]|uniref:META domain-containing protein n=1 Tax=Winogradskyella aquimaris TaxID=864074 RepID=A0ABU5EM36_9FLAO|nr:META domain-containing protein [Winogradskyella aquimaris]MDY2586830.1 META domain-containing protein [Winogradskyella aquimaris]
MKKIVIVFSVIALVMSCNSNKKETSVIWVSGYKTNCDMGAGKSTCLIVSKQESLDNQKWELFYTNIEGFEFEEGQLQKVEVKEQKLNDEDMAADKSSFSYQLVKLLEKKPDNRIALQSEWQLEKMNGEALIDSMTIPTLVIDLLEMRLSGNSGCNSYTGSITELGLNKISMSEMAKTLKLCPEANYEDEYMNLLKKVKVYEVNGANLNFKDVDGKEMLQYRKLNKTKNEVRIHDIWNAVRVGGYPINRMVTVPRLEVNTQDMKIYGNDGCNEYFGSITQLSNTAITIENIGSTRKMCPDMEFPERYMNALKQVKGYDFEENILILKNTNDEEVLAFIKGD